MQWWEHARHGNFKKQGSWVEVKSPQKFSTRYFFLQMFKLRWLCQQCCCRLSRHRSSCCSNSIRMNSCRLSSSGSSNKSTNDSQLESDGTGSLPSALLVSTRNSSTQFKVFSPELSAGEVIETDRSGILIVVYRYRYLFVDFRCLKIWVWKSYFSVNLDDILRASAFCEALNASRHVVKFCEHLRFLISLLGNGD